MLFSPTDLADLRALERSAMPDTVVISTPAAPSADGFGGQTTPAPTTVTTVGLLMPLGQTPQERTIADRVSGAHVVAVALPYDTAVTDAATLTINGTTTVQVLGVLNNGQWATAIKAVGKVLT